MAKITKFYDEDSIKSLAPREFCRLRPATYLGSNEYSTQLVREIFSNALDEHTSGRGNYITIDINTKTNTYQVIDNGQGFPINTVREDGETILQAAFDVMNTSGKYDEDGCYFGSIGLNGIGSKLTTFLSTSLDVVSYNSNGDFEHIWFKDGIFKKREVGKEEHISGTTVIWTPDPQFFQNKEANISELKTLFKGISALCPKLIIKLIIDGKEEIFHSDEGLQSLVNVKKEILKNRFICRKEIENCLFDVCMTYTSDYSENITAYVNYGLTESGVHISTVKAGLARQINKYASDNNLLKKNDEALVQAELSEGLVLVFNVKATNVKYDSQVKTKVVDIDRTLINSVINNEFVDWLKNNPKDIKTIIDKALLARKAKEAAQKAKDIARGLKVKKDKFIDLPDKLIDATPKDKDRSKCILYCVEGDSAANGLCSKRDGQIHGIMPLRGKILSVRKASVQDMMKNQEISNIIKALGLEIDIQTYTLKYDLKKLRYHKIILLEDGDSDGAAIRMLLITLFWRLCPDLVIHGHIYSSRPPLFKITTSKNEYIFLEDEKAFAKYKKDHSGEKYLVQRSKGLGEMSPDELYECMIKDGNNNIMQITVDNIDECDNVLETFMGTKVEGRKDYYNNHYNDIEINIE